MNAFEALAKLDSSNVAAIHAICPTTIDGQYITDVWIKSDMAQVGIVIRPEFLSCKAAWTVAYICENCSGNGMMEKIEYHKVYRKLIHSITNEVCSECNGEKMIWSDK